MTLKFCSFSSGSSGNCYLIESENTALLVDAGISAKSIKQGLEKTKTDISKVKGVLITHEHTDHVKGLNTILKRSKDLVAYSNESTWGEINCKSENVKHFVTGTEFWVEDLLVKSFATNHDAVEPVGYSISCEGKQITVVTDTGHIDSEMMKELTKADILILEANHDVDMLKCGNYPWFLKKRVMGSEGHLSNVACGEALCEIFNTDRKPRVVLLAHLSQENNFPDIAKQTVVNILEEQKFIIGEDVYIETIQRDEIGYVYKV